MSKTVAGGWQPVLPAGRELCHRMKVPRLDDQITIQMNRYFGLGSADQATIARLTPISAAQERLVG
jgi:hypothetical protein